MKRLWVLRLLFIIVCFAIVLFLGLRRGISLLELRKDNEGYNLVINEVMVNNRSSIRDDEGDFEDWIEICNKGDTAVNLKDFGLSNNSKQPFLWTFPHTLIEPGAYCIVWASEKNKAVPGTPLHVNFKIKSKDKAVILTAPDAAWHDIFLLQPMGDNISCGRLDDGGVEIYGFDGGTPGQANTGGETLAEGPNTKRLGEPLFSLNGGFYTQPFDLILRTKEKNAVIYYTLDGSVPTKESQCYTRPILIPSKENGATVVRARAYKDGYPSSRIVTQSYFVEKNIFNRYNTPVISLVTDPGNLFDYEKGIYVAGKVLDQWKLENPNGEIKKYTPANYNQRGRNWEREASVELFETDGTVGILQNIGFRISGDNSRANSLKSLSLLARNDYDNKECFMYSFFDSEMNKYYRILLRTSATDSQQALFRDAFIQGLVQPLPGLDTQCSTPCIVYINGEYYGIHNIREAYDRNYVSTHYNMKPEDVVIIKNPTGIAGVEIQEGHVGDEMHYNRMIAYLKEHDPVTDSDFGFIRTQMDIDNFIEYCILQIYCDNGDWPGGNIRVWRKRTRTCQPNAPFGHDGRWRWMVFDLDFGFGLFDGTDASNNNSLARATEENGPDWPNPPWSTFLLRSLLKNAGFKKQFINTFADRLNTVFSSETAIDRLEDMEQIYYPNVDAHIKRWGLHDNNIENWRAEVEVMKSFAVERPRYMRQHIVEHFGLEGTSKIRIDMDKGGSVRVNSLSIGHTSVPWDGVYFRGLPITVEAVPNPGFIFVGWEGINKSKDKNLKIDLSETAYLKAVFKREKAYGY